MICSSCGHENRVGASFCDNCGAKLNLVCASCGNELRDRAKFCDSCGTPAGNVGAQVVPDEERRLVSALFCDIVGFTPLAERLDPEEIRQIQRDYFSRMNDVIARHSGTVEKYAGDAILTLFGVPAAHDDDAERAVRCALEMREAFVEIAAMARDRWGVDLALRIGVNTGGVVSGVWEAGGRQEYSVSGDTVNTAARLQSAAEPGGVIVGEQTMRLAQRGIRFGDPVSLTLKGKSRPVLGFSALEAHTRRRERWDASGAVTPLVGREAELDALRDRMVALRNGRGSVVAISGEAGIGKSRLLLEARQVCSDDSTTWLDGQCVSYGSQIPYLPIIDLVKRAFAIDEGDDADLMIEKITARTASWEGTSRSAIPFLRFLLSLDPGDPSLETMEPLERRLGILEALGSFLREESRIRPLVLVIEDVHWIDHESEEVVKWLGRATQSLPLLLILTHRPTYSADSGSPALLLDLGALPTGECKVLVDAVLQTDSLPASVEEMILARAEGNPLYLEEITKALVETGVLVQSGAGFTLARRIEDVFIPGTIQEIILSRIDRLDRQAKTAIQLASVIGRDFTLRLLARIASAHVPLEGALHELAALQLVHQKSLFPELAYMFKHALTHDVAYSTLLIERRKHLHRAVAASIEELYADRLVEQYETLAYHYLRSEAWGQALDYLIKAGDKAAAAYANRDAVGFYGQALEVCDQLGDATLPQAADIANKRGLIALGSGRLVDAIADFNRMRMFASRMGDRHLEGLATASRGLAEYWNHDFETAEATLRSAIVFADEGYDDVRMAASLYLGGMCSHLGRMDEARKLIRDAGELADKTGDVYFGVFWSIYDGFIKDWTAGYDHALARLQSWDEAASSALFTLAYNRWCRGLCLAGKGAYSDALQLLEDLLVTCRRAGETVFESRILNTLGWINVDLQNHECAVELNMQGIQTAQTLGAPDPEIEYNARINLGDALLGLGRLEEADEQFAQVEQVVRHPQPEERWMLWRYAQHLLHSRGELFLRQGDANRALTYAAECLERATSTDSRKNIVKSKRLQGQALLALGRLAEAEEAVAAALESAHDVGNPPQLWNTLVALGDLREAQGRTDESRAAFRDALAVISDVAAGLEDGPLRDTFLTSPCVAQICKRAAVGVDARSNSPLARPVR